MFDVFLILKNVNIKLKGDLKILEFQLNEVRGLSKCFERYKKREKSKSYPQYFVNPINDSIFATRQATSSCRTSPGWKHSKDKVVERCAWRIFFVF